MLNKVVVKAVVNSPHINPIESTVYLFCQKESVLIPIKTSISSAESLILALQKIEEPRPHIHDTTRRIINALKGEIMQIVVTMCIDEVYYSYIQIEKGGELFEIDAKVTDALSIAIRCKVPIYVTSDVLLSCGVKVENLQFKF